MRKHYWSALLIIYACQKSSLAGLVSTYTRTPENDRFSTDKARVGIIHFFLRRRSYSRLILILLLSLGGNSSCRLYSLGKRDGRWYGLS